MMAFGSRGSGRASALENFAGVFVDLAKNLSNADYRDAIRSELEMMPVFARHALPWVLRARDDADVSVVKVALENAKKDPFGIALEMGDERYTWSALDDKTSQI